MLLLLGRAEVRRRPDVRVLVQRLDGERRPDLELAAVVRLVLARLAFQGVPSGNEWKTGRAKWNKKNFLNTYFVFGRS